MAECQYATLDSNVAGHKRLWQFLYDTWQAQVPADARGIDYSEFVWAIENVNSRAISGMYEGSTSQKIQNLLIVTGSPSVLWLVLGFGSLEQPLNAAVAVGVFIVLRDVFLSNSAHLKRYVVYPMIDMLNHKSTSMARASFNYFSGQFEVLSGDGESYSEGGQLYITYGKEGNDRLLQYYGFVEADNVFDSYDFAGTFLDVFIKYEDNVTVVVPLHDEEAKVDRL
jgi:hypothetical protein